VKRAGRAFTLVEVLVVLALIGLLATLLVAGSMSLLRNQGKSPDDIFWQAVLQARRTALKSGRDVELGYDEKAKAFTIDDGQSPKSIPIPEPADDLKVSFVPVDNATGASVMIAGTVVSTDSMPSVTFFHDGICTPFKVQFYARGAAHLDSIDPWTCAPVLPAPAKP
jgi:general secretion pathway protein H